MNQVFLLVYLSKAVNDTPVIFLTAKDEEKDVVKGLDTGADDYIVKPFRNRELVSRINAGTTLEMVVRPN